jgi:hypothetical protein
MSIPPIPPALESLGPRPFSFYPPVLNIEHNEWIFEKATWSEILVKNSKTGQEVWVPRRFLGEVSRVDEPVMIVGLKRELEYNAGALWPHERRIIEMPKAVNDYARPPAPAPPPPVSPVAAMRLHDGAESRIGKLILGVLAAGIVLTFIVVSFFRGRADVENVQYVGIVQQSYGLSHLDDATAVIRKLGQPAEDRWRSQESDVIQYRLLHYPKLGIYVIFMGQDRDKARYIGAMDENWKPVDAVDLPRAGNTRSMLNKLAKF